MDESNSDIQWPVGSTVDDIGPLWYLSYFTLVPCVIAGFITNIFFIVVSQEVFNQRPTIPNLLLKYLAWTDVLNCSFGVVPIILAYHLKIFTKAVCAFHGTVFTAFSVASQMIVALMSIDRYIALVHPFFYSKHLVKRHGKMAVAVYVIFVYSGVSASLPLWGLNKNVPHPPNSYCMFDWADQTPKGRLVVYLNLLNTFLCLLIIMIMNGIFRILTNQLRVLENEDADWFVSRLMAMNSVINPFLYVIMWKPYRKGCWMLLKTCLHYLTCTFLNQPTMTLSETVSL
uniref:G-protein coupled receptors family 1 profile domain-containing protein n=1 Tax=Branchiostoma floridae TaxID=7739 RepID=C3ZPE0_BRAFL|eukprot:XP_002589626.1 hypothetical protein BRAFLDRAFT_99233 [Branchiostoma floridae]